MDSVLTEKKKKKHNVGVVSWNCQLQIGTYQEHWQQPVLCNSGKETESSVPRSPTSSWKWKVKVSYIVRSTKKRCTTWELWVKLLVQLCSVQFSHSVVSDSLRPHGLQHARPPCPLPAPRVYSNSCPLVSDAIQSSHPLSSPSPLASNFSQNQGLSKWVSSSHQVAKVLEFQLQHQSFQWIFRTDFL